jgi:hypothetical protein
MAAGLIFAVYFPAHLPRASARPKPQLWFYYSTNLLVAKNLVTLRHVWRQAAEDGYTHVVLSDSKLARLNDLGSIRRRYVNHLQAVKSLAKQLHLKIIPAVFQIGYSNDLLFENPALAAGVPVRNVKFIVKNDTAHIVQHWAIHRAAQPSWKDSSVDLRGAIATIRNNPANARMAFQLQLTPFHAYHIKVWIRTADYAGHPDIKALTRTGRELQYENLAVRSTQPWRRYDVVFDSLRHRRVSVYLGVWGAARGELQWKNWSMDTAGPVNALSRPGAPTSVAGYRAGVDYSPVTDPLLGTTPYRGEYQAWHKVPVIHFLRPVPDGTILHVSWFYPPIIYHGQVNISLHSPRTRRLLSRQIQAVREMLNPAGYLMSFDEIRVMNWGIARSTPEQTPGDLLAASVRFCTGLLGSAHAYIWSDMFDPYHNARGHYYLVNGNLKGSWRGLARRVVIVNWNFAHRMQSLHFFASRGYRQIIAGYYDSSLNNLRLWKEAAAHVRGIAGYMYTTWRNDYSRLSAFARIVRTP